MMTIFRLMLVSILVAVATPSFAQEYVNIFRCERGEDATDAEIDDAASEWLAAAKKMKGGANITASLFFPVVAQTGAQGNQVDLFLVIRMPSLSEWGEFWDNYDDSPADELDTKHQDKISCPNNALWQMVPLEPAK